jgi:hypothetical protein
MTEWALGLKLRRSLVFEEVACILGDGLLEIETNGATDLRFLVNLVGDRGDKDLFDVCCLRPALAMGGKPKLYLSS